MIQQRLSVLLILLCLLLAGCVPAGIAPGNRRSLERLRLVRVLGYDAGSGISLSAAAEEPGEGGTSMLLWRSGTGFQSVMDGLQVQGNRGELFFSHTQFLVVGRAGAEEGLRPLLDYVERDESLRLGIRLFLLKSGNAGELVTASQGDFHAADALASAVRETELCGISRVSDLRETILALDEYGAAAVCLLEAAETDNGPAAIPTGYGILNHEGVLVGTLEGGAAEALGLLLDTGYPVSLRLPNGAALRYRGSAEFRPSWNADGSPGPVEVRAELRGVLTEGGTDAPDAETIAEALAQRVEQDLRKVLALAVALDADFPALGRELRRSGGTRFSALPEDWLRELEFTYRVSAVIDRDGDLAAEQQQLGHDGSLKGESKDGDGDEQPGADG